MEDAYNNFCKGYFLNKYEVKYDIESLKNVKHIMKLILPESIENYPLVALIDRYINPQKYALYRNLKILQGPISISYMTSSKYMHKICLLGENHTLMHKKTSYVQVHEFMNNYINNSPKFIDVFIEKEYKKLISIHSSHIVARVWSNRYINKFLDLIPPDCYSIDKFKCYLDTVRIHYTDLRDFTTSTIERNYKDYMSNIIAAYVMYIKGDMDPNYLHSIILGIKDFFREHRDIIDIKKIKKWSADKITIIKKQIANIPNLEIKKYITNLLANNSISINNNMIPKSFISKMHGNNNKFFHFMFPIASNYLDYN